MSTGKNTIPLCIPEIRGNEWKYIKDCLDTNWVSSVGEYVNKFERSLADYVGAKYAVACINGTAALHISLLVAGIRPGDEVIVPTLTFIAPANAVRYVGAYPVFIDVQPDTWQLDPKQIEEFIFKGCIKYNNKLFNRKTKRIIKAILPVDILGRPVDMEPVLALANKFKLKVIEDATESLGAAYKGKKVGSLSDLACFSFNGNKIITTGGGGMLVTNDRSYADKARYLTTQAKDDELEYVHNEIGYNYRLSNLQAAMGLAQMEHLNEYIAQKRRIAEKYYIDLGAIKGLTMPADINGSESINWLFTILIDKRKYGLSSRQLLRELKKQGIQSRPFWHPLHSQKPFKDCQAYNIKVANLLYRDGLSLPSSVGLQNHEQDRVIRVIRNMSKYNHEK
ncbi:MAG: LegC family aminotransferase [Candidatus Margulisiibacteriota bacterium]